MAELDPMEMTSVSELIRRVARETPDSTACSQGKESWRYGQLEAASLSLARLFDSCGLGAGDVVPIFLSRSFESVASILALMRLGICFVPMDAESWSQARVDAVLDAVQPKAVVFSTVTPLAASTGMVSFSDIKSCLEEGAAWTSERIDAQHSAEAPIYIIFTSGTTGRPKGVVVPRRCIDNYVRQGRQQAGGMPFHLDVEAGDRVLLLFSLAFDGTAFPILQSLVRGRLVCSFHLVFGVLILAASWGVFFSTLCRGGELVLSEPSRALDDAKTCTILPATPSLLQSLGDPRACHSVRSIFLGGEAPSPALIKKWWAPGRQLFNCYGPSECTICVSMAELRPDSPIVLGQPMADTQLVVLDEKGELADEGELGIIGPGVATGYHGNAALTAERFISWRGQRLYRTLDRVRQTTDGLVFCGRTDSVVKNRGFLVNLDLDVLPAIQSSAGVASAAAFMCDGQLVAAVTPNTVDVADLRHQLAERLDSFAVPDRIHACPALPQTANGKVDIALLKASFARGGDSLHVGTTATGTAETPPLGTPSPGALQTAVARVLGWSPEAVSMQHSFWELGGHSLLAMQLLAVLREAGYSLAFEDVTGRVPLSTLEGKLAVVDELDVLADEPDANTAAKDTAPITPAQLGMARSSIRQPGRGYLLVSMHMATDGQAEFGERLRGAWQTVLGRHAIFRTSFDLLAGTQRPGEAFQMDWQSVSVSAPDKMSAAVALASTRLWDALQHDEDSHIFVPTCALRLLINKSEATLLWLVHHSMLDGWSMGLVVREVQAVLRGEVLPQPPPSPSFIDFAQRLPQHAISARRTGNTFWKTVLADMADVSPLRLPRPSETSQTHGPHQFSAHEHEPSWVGPSRLHGLSESVPALSFAHVEEPLVPWPAVRQICAGLHITPAAVLHAAWALLLRAYAPQNHVAFGSVFSGRDFPLAGMHDLVGPTLNMCPFPVDVSRERLATGTRADFLASIQDLLRRIHTHQWSAADAMQEHMPGSQARLLQTALFLEYDLDPVLVGSGLASGSGSGALSFPRWRFDREDRPEFELTVSVRRLGNNHLGLRILFDKALYTRPVVRRMTIHLRNLVHALLDPRCSTVAAVRDRMLDAGEVLSLTTASASLYEPYVGPPDLKTAFERGVDRWSDAIAVETYISNQATSRSNQTTYRQLDSMANTAARCLVAAAVSAGDAIAVVSDRSLHWIVAVIAVIKAGAVYVPLDSKLPSERMAVMITTSNAKLCLFSSQADHRRLGPSLAVRTPAVCIADMLSGDNERPNVALRPGDPAYITFTSGSTGVPKGVCISHEAVLSYLAYGPASMDARPGRRHAQMFSPGFDVSQAELFGTLIRGATLVLADPFDPFAHLTRVHATMITPSFLSVCTPASLANLDTILFAGEAVPQALADRWAAPGRTIYNSYGPCECTIGCLFQPLHPGTEVTLGHTIPRVAVYILDEDARPVPPGVPGEICLSGIQIAAGYLGPGMEAQSRSRFVPDPFCPGLRMYRTGDCAIWTEDMEPLFQGRFDNQIKIRGYRVELTEIENVIRLASAQVRRAAAVVQRDVIVAFVEPATVDVPAVQAHLRRVLPAYACPSRIVALPTLPTMPNQKLDRKALQAYKKTQETKQPDQTDQADRLNRSDHSKQSNQLKQAKKSNLTLQLLADAWCSAIGLPSDTAANMDAETDFFAWGGSSLSQIRVAQIVSQRLGTKLPLKLFIWNTTLSSLSGEITDYLQQHASAPAASFTRPWNNIMPPYDRPSPLETEFVLLSTSSPTPQAFNVAVHLRITGRVHLKALKSAANAILAGEPLWQSCYAVENGKVLRRLSSAPCEVICPGEGAAAVNLDRLVCEPFDLSSGPLSRLLLSQHGSDTTIILVQHHAVTDKSTIQAFFRRLQLVYTRSHDTPVHQKPDYMKWAQWKASQVRPLTPLHSPIAEYWQKQLDGLPPPLFKQLAGFPAVFAGQSTMVVLSPSTSAVASMELFVSLVGLALASTLAIQDMVVAIPYVDRSEPGTEDMLGVFVDRLPLRLTMPAHGMSRLSSELVASVGSLVRDALAHAAPFQEIRTMTGHDDIFQAMIVYNRREDSVARSFSIPGVDVAEIPIQTTGAKFPLLVEFIETDESTLCHLEYMENLVSPSMATAISCAIRDIWSTV